MPCKQALTLRLDDDSQGGNILFPGWECFVPKVGIIITFDGKNEGTYCTTRAFRQRIRATYFEKTLIPPVKASEGLCLKVFC
jgi:hypothetical protein